MPAATVLKLSVVGHTNVGKTSLLRTLLRDSAFGEVAPTAATTRQVEAAQLLADGRPVVELYDTPGLEDASGLIEFLEPDAVERHAGPERIARFLASTEAAGRFEQEARVLGQMLASEAAIYVIDAREPVLGKYQDELAILGLCARPILPVLNFLSEPSARVAEWREALARVGLHVLAEFDTVAYSLSAETRLWQRVATLVDAHAEALARLIEDRSRRRAALHAAALRLIAELLVDAAGARATAARGQPAENEAARRSLQQGIERRERAFVRDLLRLYRFPLDALAYLPLPLSRDGWRVPLFDAAMLGRLGKGASGGLAAGAAAGAAVDLATGGLSLGVGTLVGSLVGGGGSALWMLRDRFESHLRGFEILALDDAALGHLGARALALVAALEQRGHAAQSPLQWRLTLSEPWPRGRLPAPLAQARHVPKSSILNGPAGSVREELAERMAATLERSRG